MISLHNHSYYSLLDGFNSPKEIISKAKDVGHEAIAISDHGCMHGYLEFYKGALEQDIKPILGVEFYLTKDISEKIRDNYHLLALAKNKKGLKNLFKLLTIANKKGFYYNPRIDFELLSKYSEGLTISSACLAGMIPRYLENDNIKKAKEIASKYKSVFHDDFYLEIMANKLPEQYEMNKKLVDLSKEVDIPLIATSDMHYLEPEDAEVHDVMLCIGTKSEVDERNRFRFKNDQFYFKDEDRMEKQLFDEPGYEDIVEESLKNTEIIGKKIEEYDITLGEKYFPKYNVPKQYSVEEYLSGVCHKQLKKLVKEEGIDYEEYKERIEYELEIIVDKGYSSYFLIVGDFLRWAKNNNILSGVGRGSAAGCLVSYLLGITAVDPIEHGLLFQRFLNPGRDSPPDIDLDLTRKDREKVIDYVKNKYGEENVAQICTFGTMAAKAAIKDTGRALGMSFGYLNDEIVRSFPKHYDDLEDAIKGSDKLKKYKGKHPKLFKYASKLEDKPRHLGTHAAAVVITPEPVIDYTPLAKTGEDIVTQVEMHDSEELGMMKMDFLGLKTLDIIEKTISFIHKRDDLDKFDFVPTINNIWNLPLDNEDIYKNIYQKADTNGVFQVESQLFKKLLKDMKPEEFEHIVALNAIGRPGVLDAKLDQEYFDRMHGEKEIEYPCKELKPVLENTYGLAIFQEEIMKMAQVVAGFSLSEGDILRKAIGKKIEKLMAEQYEKFVNGAIENGYDKEFAEDMFSLIEKFAGYGLIF